VISLDEKTGEVHPILEEIVRELNWPRIALVTALSTLLGFAIVLLVLVVT
jgi:hypothetical protein